MKFHFDEPEGADTGPWLITDDAANDVAEVFSNENSTVSISRKDSIATARLFAASSDLLAALTELTNCHANGGYVLPNDDVLAAARAAIAKAEGQSRD